jgi:hypothetical protein
VEILETAGAGNDAETLVRMAMFRIEQTKHTVGYSPCIRLSARLQVRMQSRGLVKNIESNRKGNNYDRFFALVEVKQRTGELEPQLAYKSPLFLRDRVK